MPASCRQRGVIALLRRVIVARSRLQVRMNARGQALRLGDELQKRDEARALRRVEGTQQLGLVLIGDALEVGKHLAPRRRQVQPVCPPVTGVASSLGEPTTLEVVDQRDDRAAVDPKRGAEGLLGLAFGGREVAEHSEVPGMEVESGQALGEAPMRMGAELREQETGTPAQLPRRGCVHAGGISGHLAMVPCAPDTVLEINSLPDSISKGGAE